MIRSKKNRRFVGAAVGGAFIASAPSSDDIFRAAAPISASRALRYRASARYWGYPTCTFTLGPTQLTKRFSFQSSTKPVFLISVDNFHLTGQTIQPMSPIRASFQYTDCLSWSSAHLNCSIWVFFDWTLNQPILLSKSIPDRWVWRTEIGWIRRTMTLANRWWKISPVPFLEWMICMHSGPVLFQGLFSPPKLNCHILKLLVIRYPRIVGDMTFLY